MRYKNLGVPFDRDFRNDSNENFQDISDDIDKIVGTSNSAVFEQMAALLEIDSRNTNLIFSNGLLTTIEEKDGSNVIKTTTINYDEQGQVQSVSESAGGKTVTYTLQYSSGEVTGVSKTLA
ncbi:hypothetical protein [Bacillus sp. 03113]|uniref:hypothetical protein n=1 Tax=Bacillus sp. 03113 TaxID=2578211 RepID=UPI0011411AE5|nr:hypothetical protein [Bacillus sp. 03113]